MNMDKALLEPSEKVNDPPIREKTAAHAPNSLW